MGSHRQLRRRKFLKLSGMATFGWCALEPWLLEPHWLRVKQVDLGTEPIRHRIVHLTDIHYKGDRTYLEKVVAVVNRLSPDFICFCGDLVEQARFVDPALEILSQLRAPVYGVPGNHDYKSDASFEAITQFCQSTGGAWLIDQTSLSPDGQIQIIGATGTRPSAGPLELTLKRILLVHYPLYVQRVRGTFDVVLSGHSHGGQVRIPFGPALVLPYDVGPYDLGLFQTPVGPLYVSPGIGTLSFRVRVWCRPEITVITL